MELRHKLLQRDQRVSELKDALAAKGKAFDEAKRKLQHDLPVPATTGAVTASLRGASPARAGRPIARRTAPKGVAAVASSTGGPASDGQRGSDITAGGARGGAAAWSGDQDDPLLAPRTGISWPEEGEEELWGQEAASLRLEAAQRGAEVERLKGEWHWRGESVGGGRQRRSGSRPVKGEWRTGEGGERQWYSDPRFNMVWNRGCQTGIVRV